jgi:glycosyltransferase involved in cell wall biosynthesis
VSRILFLSNIPTPYQLDFLECVVKRDDLRALFLWSREGNRDWVLEGRPWLNVINYRDSASGWEAVRHAAEQFHPEVVLIGGYRLPLAERLKWWCRRRRVPVYYWLESPLPASPLRAALRRLAWRLQLPTADGVIGIGERAVQAYRHVARRTCNIPYSIDVARYTTRPAEAVKRPIRFLFVGQYIHRKGVVELLDAFAGLAPEDAALTLVGSGELLPTVDDYARRYRQIRHGGFLNPAEIAGLYSQHDVFVLPSRHDGWAVVICEAMAAGLPVIGTLATGAFKEFIQDKKNGVVCEVTPDSIRASARYYIENSGEIAVHGRRNRDIILASTAASHNAAQRLHEFLSPE